MVFYRAPDSATSGELLVGRAAYNFWPSAPACLERTPKRRIGFDHLRLGESDVSTTDAIAKVLREALDAAVRQCAGVSPSEVYLTHPARWVSGGSELAQLTEAAGKAGLATPKFMSEPEAAAVFFASSQLNVGEYVAVYDFGGGTLDTAILQRTQDGFELVGEPGGDGELGGEDFDDRLYKYLGSQLAPEHWECLRKPVTREWAQASRALREEARRAKEALSRNAECPVYIPLPVNQDILVTQGELRELIAKDVLYTVDQLEDTIDRSTVEPDKLSAVFLAGGSSQIPLVASTISERLTSAPVPTTLGDPKTVVARGAARYAIEHRTNGNRASVGAKRENKVDQPAPKQNRQQARRTAEPGPPKARQAKPPAAPPAPPAPQAAVAVQRPLEIDPFRLRLPGRVNFGSTGRAKIRAASTGNLLSVLTLGVYLWFWWYFINSELRDIGREVRPGDPDLAASSPARSLLAVTLGGLLVIPYLVSSYRGARRLKHAQLLCGIAPNKTIKPVLAFLLVFPFGILIVPRFIYFWYMTKHQNAAIVAAAERTRQ
jgi:actin-like ATPase involved in cell morphogenesis